MKWQERVQGLIEVMPGLFPNAECALHHDTPFQLLVATILSAQCTDKKVNEITPNLFKKFPTPEAFAQASIAQIEKEIKSIGLFRSKAKNIKSMATDLVEKHNSEVPQSLGELVKLGGVGRKTANVVLGECFGTSEGVVVDTHVQRLSQLIGLTKYSDPIKIERDLNQKIPREYWVKFSHWLILHGRQTCIARRPQCDTCKIRPYCARRGLKAQILKKKKTKQKRA